MKQHQETSNENRNERHKLDTATGETYETATGDIGNKRHNQTAPVSVLLAPVGL